MRRPTFLGVLAALAFVAAATPGRVGAQTLTGASPSGPAVNPILNLTRLGAPLGVNYYNIVQPQIQFGSAIANLQQNQAAIIQSGYGGVANPYTPLVTGHPTVFGNPSHYFITRGATGGIGGLASQQNMQNQRMLYSPTRFLGGINSGMGLGGVRSSGIGPGVNPGSR